MACAIVGGETVAERAKLMAHFVAVAAALRKLHNYNGMMAIIAGLGNAAVHRLKHTEAALGKQVLHPAASARSSVPLCWRAH